MPKSAKITIYTSIVPVRQVQSNYRPGLGPRLPHLSSTWIKISWLKIKPLGPSKDNEKHMHAFFAIHTFQARCLPTAKIPFLMEISIWLEVQEILIIMKIAQDQEELKLQKDDQVWVLLITMIKIHLACVPQTSQLWININPWNRYNWKAPLNCVRFFHHDLKFQNLTPSQYH